MFVVARVWFLLHVVAEQIILDVLKTSGIHDAVWITATMGSLQDPHEAAMMKEPEQAFQNP